MNSKEAIQTAKDYVNEVFSGEGVIDLGLEEIRYNEMSRIWSVTVGFSRPWDHPRTVLGPLTPKRTFKVVDIRDRDGEIEGLRAWTKPDE